jgi:hypothetical protein
LYEARPREAAAVVVEAPSCVKCRRYSMMLHNPLMMIDHLIPSFQVHHHRVGATEQFIFSDVVHCRNALCGSAPGGSSKGDVCARRAPRRTRDASARQRGLHGGSFSRGPRQRGAAGAGRPSRSRRVWGSSAWG